MANETETTNQDNNPGKEPAPKHESWFEHIVDEIKEEIAELTEEAENMGGEFSAVGNGETNYVHDHHHDDDEPKEEKKED